MNSAEKQIEETELMELDNFCWTCHRTEPVLFCNSCVRTFHDTQTCSRSNSQVEKGQWDCPECIAIRKDEHLIKSKQINKEHLNKMLNIILEHLKTDEYLVEAFMNIDYSIDAPDAVNPIDLNTIAKKIENAAYTCCEAFLSDIKWIIHNVKVFWSDDDDAIKATKWLLEMVKEDVYSIRMCDECYANIKRNEFEAVCKQPHLLIWAKQKTYPYWPAKLMSVNIERNTVDVRYFGEKHYRAILSPKDCFMYSHTNPSIILGVYKKSITQAQKEANAYIENLTKKYGSFNYASSNSVLNVDKLERHLFDMIPNAWKQLGKDVVPPSIQKPGSATLARRQSVPARRMSTSTSTITSKTSTGRIATRRMSMMADLSTLQNSSNQNGNNWCQPIEKLAYEQKTKSVQVNINKTIGSNNDSTVSHNGTAKKRKLDNSEVTNGSDTIIKECSKKNITTSNKSPFKVPKVPKCRKLFNKDNTILINPAIIENVRALNELSKNQNCSTSSNNGNITPAKHSTEKKLCSQTIIHQHSKDTLHSDNLVIKSFNTQSSEMVKLCNAVVERNTRQVTECIRSSLETTLEEFLNLTKSKEQLPPDPNLLIDIQSKFNQRIDSLKLTNDGLLQDLNALNAKHQTLVLKNTSLTKNLNEEMKKNARLVTSLESTLKENSELKSMMTKLQTSNRNKDQILMEIEKNNKELMAMNESLRIKNNRSESPLQRMLQWRSKI